jgi:hypothetical protein
MDNLKCTGLVLVYNDGQWVISKVATNRGVFEVEKNCEEEEIQKFIGNAAGFLFEQVQHDVIAVLEDETK